MMKVLWPFGAVPRGVASNHHMLRRLNTFVVSDVEKAPEEASGGDQEGERKRIAIDVPLEVKWHQNRGLILTSGGVWREPDCWPGGVRYVGDASLVCGCCVERGKAHPDTPALCVGAGRGSVPTVEAGRD